MTTKPRTTGTVDVGTRPRLGYGVGWRPEIDDQIADLPGLGFVEVIAENIDPERLPPSLLDLRARGVTVIPHGVGLNLGGAERPHARRLAHLAAVARALDAPLVSEHIAFCRAGDLDSGHLLPVPRTRAALRVISDNVRRAQAALPVPLALENVAPLLRWPDDELTEGQFVGALAEDTDTQLLIDVANLHTTRVNLGLDPLRTLAELPLERLAYVHVAGGAVRDGLWHDTHTHPVTAPVTELLAELAARVDPPGVLLERDGSFPPPAEFTAEFTLLEQMVATAARPTRAATPPSSPGGPPSSPGGPPSSSGGWRSRAGGWRGRGKLAAAQRALLAAMVSGAPVPAGFEESRVGVQARGLMDKRLWVTARHRPDLVDLLGRRFPDAFRAYAAGNPRPAGGGCDDAEAFARYLHRWSADQEAAGPAG